MILLDGTITNKIINGVNGEFSVGTFQTEIGKFKIRSALLDQYEEGEYSVRVAVNKFDLNSYQSKRNGIIITEIEAHIDTLELIEGDIKPVQESSIEPDASVDKEPSTMEVSKPAMDTEKPVKPAKGKLVLSNKKKAKSTVDKDNVNLSEDSGLKILFGHLWPLGDSIKQDLTTPRTIIIQQVTYLRKYYDFDAKTQIWTRKK